MLHIGRTGSRGKRELSRPRLTTSLHRRHFPQLELAVWWDGLALTGTRLRFAAGICAQGPSTHLFQPQRTASIASRGRRFPQTLERNCELSRRS